MRLFIVEGTDENDCEVRNIIEAPDLSTAYEIANDLAICIDDIIEAVEEKKGD